MTRRRAAALTAAVLSAVLLAGGAGGTAARWHAAAHAPVGSVASGRLAVDVADGRWDLDPGQLETLEPNASVVGTYDVTIDLRGTNLVSDVELAIPAWEGSDNVLLAALDVDQVVDVAGGGTVPWGQPFTVVPQGHADAGGGGPVVEADADGEVALRVTVTIGVPAWLGNEFQGKTLPDAELTATAAQVRGGGTAGLWDDADAAPLPRIGTGTLGVEIERKATADDAADDTAPDEKAPDETAPDETAPDEADVTPAPDDEAPAGPDPTAVPDDPALTTTEPPDPEDADPAAPSPDTHTTAPAPDDDLASANERAGGATTDETDGPRSAAGTAEEDS
ncbi:hypothetical protein [Isoptericola sp. NPDC057559]|uniref:hypothetical protein n=1 Tax=Isoptericola sp. NPDC057559 TaxID=3346168 RepID=UPI003681DF7E